MTDSTSPRESELERRVQLLEHRLSLLETHLKVPSPRTPAAAPVIPPPAIADYWPMPAPPPAAPPPALPVDEAMMHALLDRKRAARHPDAAADATASTVPQVPPFIAQQMPPPPPLAYRPVIPPAPPLEEGDLEQTIGLKWAGWIGALVVVFGAALGVKYAYDAGWFALAPPELRMSLMAICGFALIGAGEVVYRKVNRASAAGLFAAGVATLFLVSYTGYGFLDVYNQQVAFTLMGLTTLVGAAVAVRGKLLSIAVLSLLGGHLTPLVLGGDASKLLPLLSYLLMLQAIALFLAWWGGTTRWWTLRWLALVTTSQWMIWIFGAAPVAPDGLPFTFTLIYAGLFLAELMISAVRPTVAPDVVDEGAAVAFSLVLTGALVLATLFAQQEAEKLVRGAWIVAYAAVYAVAGFGLTRAAAGRMLAIALRTQAAALVVLAVPVALSGSAVVLVWAGMAVVFGVVGAQLNLLISRIASVCTWGAAVLYLPSAVSDPELSPSPEDVAFTIASVEVPVYVVLAWLVALAGVAVAWLLTTMVAQSAPLRSRHSDGEAGPDHDEALVVDAVEEPGWSVAVAPSELVSAAQLLSVAAGGVWVIASLLGLPQSAATLALVLYAWLLALLDIRAARLGLAVQAMAVMVFAAMKWAVVDLLAERLSEGWTIAQLNYLPVINPLMALGALIAMSLAAIYWLRRRPIDELLNRAAAHAQARSTAMAVAAALVVLVTFGLTLEIDRLIERARLTSWPLVFRPEQVRLLLFTVLWCLSSMLVAGLVIRLKPDPERRRRALAPLAILPILLAAKFLAVDTLLWHLLEGRVRGMVLLNIESLTALVVLAAIGLYAWPLRHPPRADEPRSVPIEPARGRGTAGVLGIAALLVVLLAVQWEIGRGMNYLSVTPLARGVAVSVWWSLFAVATVAAGFLTRTAGLRYFGLAMFAITLLKVFIIDLQTLDRGWRTISFIALGLLLLGTSVIYGKYSPKLLGEGRR